LLEICLFRSWFQSWLDDTDGLQSELDLLENSTLQSEPEHGSMILATLRHPETLLVPSPIT